MKIKINSLQIHNFKCFRFYSVDFLTHVTTISGDNGTGKTTVADAISWCLFGKDTQNRSQFDIKCHDENGQQVYPKEPVIVTLELECDGQKHSVERRLKEKWQTLRGETTEVFKGNYTEYSVNGNLLSQAEYQAFISKLINETVFRAITNPTYFLSQKWQDQRAFLSRLVGHISDKEVVGTDPKFEKLITILEHEDITSYLKHIGFKINEIKKKLDDIPVRLEELDKAMPETERPKEEIYNDISYKTGELNDIQGKINSIKQGNTASVVKNELNKKLDFANKRKREMEQSATNREKECREQAKLYIEERDADILRENNLIHNLNASIDSDKMKIEKALESIKYYETVKTEIKKEWNEKVNIKINPKISENDKYCPLCGQEMPEEKLIERINQIKEEAERKRIETREMLLIRIKEVNNQIKIAAHAATEAETNIEDKNKKLTEEKERLETIKNTPDPVVKTYEEFLAENPNYQKVLDEIKELEDRLDNAPVNEDNFNKLRELQESHDKLKSEIASLQSELAMYDQKDRVQKLIDDANNDQKNLAEQLASLQRDEDLAKEFSDKADSMLEEKVNKYFQIVKWKMFRQMINGNKESYCECYVDGTAYHDTLNSASKLNAGLDIIRTLCKIYDSYAPIIIDNAESTNEILDTESQQIRLYVTQDKKLTVN